MILMDPHFTGKTVGEITVDLRQVRAENHNICINPDDPIKTLPQASASQQQSRKIGHSG